MFIGLTGNLGSGKDTAADFLKARGFTYYSLSDILRQECQARGLLVDRDHLVNIGNELRQKHGPAVLAHRILAQIKNDEARQAVIVSIRNPYEVEALKAAGGFFLWNITAPVELRYQRIRQRGNERDQVSFDKFKAQEEKESQSQDPNSQQLIKVGQMADTEIDNSGSREDLGHTIENILKKISYEH